MGDKPWKDSLWMDCLLELMEKYRKEGKAYVNFSEVDELVVLKSKSIVNYSFEDGG